MPSALLAAQSQECDVECVFCDEFLLASQSPFDHAFAESKTLRLLPALGMLVPGYFLAVTRSHVLSTAELAAEDREEFHNQATGLARQLATKFGRYLVFEHGSCAGSGSCIGHAHLHLIPTNEKLDSLLLGQLRWTSCLGPADFDRLQGREYGYLQTAGNHFLHESSKVPSQWVRQMVARNVGAEVWDWALDPGEANLAATTARLQDWRSDPMSTKPA